MKYNHFTIDDQHPDGGPGGGLVDLCAVCVFPAIDVDPTTELLSSASAVATSASIKNSAVRSIHPGRSPRRGNHQAQSHGPKGARPTYADHIHSTAWQTVRLAELEASGFRCRICNRGACETRLEVHHRTYENFGRELTEDLTTLCSDCHVINTDALRRRRYAKFVPILADVVSVERGPLFDPIRKGTTS
jgi:5-methylcytosine-specific restriction endonuclease McrA